MSLGSFSCVASCLGVRSLAVMPLARSCNGSSKVNCVKGCNSTGTSGSIISGGRLMITNATSKLVATWLAFQFDKLPFIIEASGAWSVKAVSLWKRIKAAHKAAG